MRYPLIALVAGAALLVILFGIGWAGWFGGAETTSSPYLWTIVGGLAACILWIVGWGYRLAYPRDRRRWFAFSIAAVLLIALGVWWIASIGLIIALVGGALLVYSLARLYMGERKSP